MNAPPDDERLRLIRRQQAVDYLRFELLEDMAVMGASYWRSLAEAARRTDEREAKAYCKKIAIVTKAAFDLAKSIGSPPACLKKKPPEAAE